MNANSIFGKVILAGAGPGDADLITVRLQKALAEADVIISDRLVNPSIVWENAREGVLLIEAGKQGYHDGSTDQKEINHLLLEHARLGRRVVRLKGGDVSFFSNLLDELDTLFQNNIQFEIIPGITAASGAAAYAGIPLTARGYSQGVMIDMYSPRRRCSPEKWKALAQCGDTLVFYMSARHLQSLVGQLILHGFNPNTALAVIEQATTVHQRIRISRLNRFERDFEEVEFSSPSLVIVGNVVTLNQKFDWYTDEAVQGSLFHELSHT